MGKCFVFTQNPFALIPTKMTGFLMWIFQAMENVTKTTKVWKGTRLSKWSSPFSYPFKYERSKVAEDNKLSNIYNNLTFLEQGPHRTLRKTAVWILQKASCGICVGLWVPLSISKGSLIKMQSLMWDTDWVTVVPISVHDLETALCLPHVRNEPRGQFCVIPLLFFYSIQRPIVFS